MIIPSRCRQTRMLLCGVLFFSHALFAGFAVSMEPGIGYKTNIPSQESMDSLSVIPFYENRAVVSMSAEPSWSCSLHNQVCYTISGAILMDYYLMHGPEEISTEGEVTAAKESESYSTIGGIGLAYYSIPTGNDPTVPWNYWEYSMHVARTYKRKNPLVLSYALSTLSDIATSQIDLKNAFKVKMNGRIHPRLRIFASIGCEGTFTFGEQEWYLRPLLACGATVLIDEENFAFLQIHASRPFFKTDYAANAGSPNNNKNKNKKPPIPSGIDSVRTVQPRIWHIMAFASYCRTLSAGIDLFLNYDFTALDPGEPEPIYLSHKIGVSLEWSM